ncbi:MAG: BON domain-containing protein, partial [Chitinivibrionales bacterium]|nr:BON domain-containing protein [Chitinivibrionales bacterium]
MTLKQCIPLHSLLPKQFRFFLICMASVLFSGTLIAGPETAEKEIADSEITEAVEHTLMLDKTVAAHLISVSTNDGIVTLTGSVANILEKDRAEELATTIKGVRSVVNGIDVLPVIRSESRIRSDVISALAVDPATEQFEIDVSVDAATVTLTGTVDSYTEKRLASTVTKGVKGVKTIRNEIEVAFEKGRPDHEIQAEIERRLEIDPYTVAPLIEVEVLGGEVTLSGTVGTLNQKIMA